SNGIGRSFLRRALRRLATPMGSYGKRKTPRLLRGVMRFAESPRKRSQAEPSRVQRLESGIPCKPASPEQVRSRRGSGRAGVGRNPMERRLRLPVTLFRSLQDPTFFVDHPVMRPAQ